MLVAMDVTQDADVTADVTADVVVLRAEDPRCPDLESSGYALVGESWGARLRLAEPPDLPLAAAAVDRAVAMGIDVRELGADAADAVRVLEDANHPDYPFTPATAHVSRNLKRTRALWAEGKRVFGALDGTLLVAVTAIEPAGQHGETKFTSVLVGYRGRGIGSAVKAASILALAADGVRTFDTGGAGVNEASLGANRALGYVIEERWRSYQRD